MSRTVLDALITRAALDVVTNSGSDMLVDHLLRSGGNAADLGLKNVCAKVSVKLSDEIDSICSFLSISKRAFLEAAFIEAVAKAKAILEAEGVEEWIAAQSQPLVRLGCGCTEEDISRQLDANE
jgi:hypothetical protein